MKRMGNALMISFIPITVGLLLIIVEVKLVKGFSLTSWILSLCTLIQALKILCRLILVVKYLHVACLWSEFLLCVVILLTDVLGWMKSDQFWRPLWVLFIHMQHLCFAHSVIVALIDNWCGLSFRKLWICWRSFKFIFWNQLKHKVKMALIAAHFKAE